MTITPVYISLARTQYMTTPNHTENLKMSLYLCQKEENGFGDQLVVCHTDLSSHQIVYSMRAGVKFLFLSTPSLF